MQPGADYKFWAKEPGQLMSDLNSSAAGLTDDDAKRRRDVRRKPKPQWIGNLYAFLSQFRSPLSLLLIVAIVLSSVLSEFQDSAIIFAILLSSSLLSFLQERKATVAAEKLRSFLQLKATVKRVDSVSEMIFDEVVYGDIVILDAGDIIPADGVILQSKDLYINESVLTGESIPAEKKACVLEESTPLNRRVNSVFQGTSVISGSATVMCVYAGSRTILGNIEHELEDVYDDTAFEKGIRQFGYMLMKTALVLTGVILIVNISRGNSPLESVLFALALSVGLTPELLPAIVSITLSAGANRLVKRGVIVKRLSSVQNLGAIDVLCSDKTGTLTEGVIKVHGFVSADNKPDEVTALYAFLNSSFESGYPNPMDQAIRDQCATDISEYAKFDEVPYDFVRKRLSIVVARGEKHLMITKGALESILGVCSQADLSGSQRPLEEHIAAIRELFSTYSKKGFRVIGLCYKDVTGDPVIDKNDESEMIFRGFILLHDPPKKDIREVVQNLKERKIGLKIITGDNTLIAETIASEIGVPSSRIIPGKELNLLSDEAVMSKVEEIDVFAETEPAQKERIVRALQKKGHVVGYLGDGINDASALKSADVGISVSNAMDVARESADMILTGKDLAVLSNGILEGRKTYLNTLKYISITVSANFGNMLSMGFASFFLPFLPLLPSQILLTNFLTDIPALSIASDKVDEEMLAVPRKWNVNNIRRFMLVFGMESSVFDLLSFAVLIWGFRASEEVFRSGWFTESVITEVLILLVIRTRRSVFRSQVGKPLLISSLIVILFVLVLPFIPYVGYLGLCPMPGPLAVVIFLISILYAIIGEMTKKMFPAFR